MQLIPYEIPFSLYLTIQLIIFLFFILPGSFSLHPLLAPLFFSIIQGIIILSAITKLTKKQQEKKRNYFFILWEIQLFLFILLQIIFRPLETLTVEELSPNAIFFVVIMLIFIEIIFLFYAIFRERVITKILFVLATSTTIIVFLIAFFVLFEGIPAFQETNPIDFITSSEWDIYYQQETTETLTLTTIISDDSFTVDTSNTTLYFTKDQTKNLTVQITNLETTNQSYQLSVDSPLDTIFDNNYVTVDAQDEKSFTFKIIATHQGISNVTISVTNEENEITRIKKVRCMVDASDVSIHLEKKEYNLKRDDSQFQIPMKITNNANQTITYNLSLQASSVFIPSFRNIAWENTLTMENATESYTFLSLSPFETKNLTLNPRFVYKKVGEHPIHIQAVSVNDENLKTNTSIIVRYSRNQLLTTDQYVKETRPKEPANYTLHIESNKQRPVNLTFELIKGNAELSLFFNDEQKNIEQGKTSIPSSMDDEELLLLVNPMEFDGEIIQTKITLIDPGETPKFGAFPFIVSTFITTLIAVFIAAPLGLGTAIFLAEFTPTHLRKILRPIYELLAGIPSVVYGLWGYITFGPFLQDSIYPFIANTIGTYIPLFSETSSMGRSVFTASIVLSIMIVPIIITLSEDAIRSVSKSLKEGSLALGATRWQTMRHIILPKAKSGIIGSIILGTGRAIGETMAVLMVMGATVRLPTSLFDSGMTMTGAIALFFEGTFNNPSSRHALFGIGSILFIMVFFLNVLILEIKRRTDDDIKKNKGALIKKIKKLIMRNNNSSKTRSKQNKVYPANTVKTKKFKIIDEQPSKKFEIITSSLNSKPTSKNQLLNQKTITTTKSQQVQSLHKSEKQENKKLTNNSIKKARKQQKIMKSIFFAFGAIVSFFIIYILGFVIINGGVSLNLELFLTREISGGKAGGFLNAILGSIYLIAIALFIAAPLSIGSAIYVQEYAKKDNIFTKIILFTSDTLASTPSIIFGAFGFIIFVLYLEFGYSLLAGGITLAFMIIPLMLRSSIESIKSIPHEINEGALALGATKWQAIRTVILPPATPGIISGVIIAMGRAIGETAAVLLTAGYASQLPSSLFAGAASMPMLIYSYYTGAVRTPILADKVYSAALILIIIVLLLNGIARIFSYRASKMMKY